MFAFFHGASVKIARNLIKVTGLAESLAVFRQNTFSTIGEAEVFKLLLGMDACNLLQTMKEDFIAKEIFEEDLLDTVDDYVVENLKAQTMIVCKDGAERMDQCQEILGIAAKFQEYWSKEETKDPGPRFYCVKEMLRRLGSEDNTPIHDNLFEFVYEQHNRFLRYFRILLEPFQTEETPDPGLSGLAFHSPSPESPGELPASPLNPEKEEETAEKGLSPTYSLDALSASPILEPFQGGVPVQSSKPTSQMLDDLFRGVNPIDDNFPGASPAPRKFPEGDGLGVKDQLVEEGPDPAE